MNRSTKENKLRSWRDVAEILNSQASSPDEHISAEIARRIGLRAMAKIRAMLALYGVDKETYDTIERMHNRKENV